MITFSQTRAPLDVLFNDVKVGSIKRIRWSNPRGKLPTYELYLKIGNKQFKTLNEAKNFVRELYVSRDDNFRLWEP